MYYFACCRDGASRKKLSKSSSRAERQSRKVGMCISRMYVRHCSYNGEVKVRYISSHTNHNLSLEQAKFVPLPKAVKESISAKLSLGIPVERILDGT